MSTRHAILALLAQGERCGYDLRRELEEFDRGWTVDYGQLYRQLTGLASEGLVAERRAAGRGGPSRKVYRLTEGGRRELERWLDERDSSFRPPRDELPLKLRLSRTLGAEGAGDLIDARRQSLQVERSMVLGARQRAVATGDPDRWLVAETCLRRIDGALAALDEYQRQRAGERTTIIATGSDDPILAAMTEWVERDHPELCLSFRPVGSFEGLLALREGRAHLAGTHLLDVESGEYNVPFIKRLLFEEPLVLVNLSHREQGLMVPAGNLKSIERIEDLARPGVRMINRQPGAGTRLLLRTKLAAREIEPAVIDGYDREAPTHDAVAEAVSRGEADVGLGIRAAAEARGLDFISLDHERYDLAIPRRLYESPRWLPLRQVLASSELRRHVDARPGYDASRTGEVVAEVG